MKGVSLVHDIEYESNPKCKLEPGDDHSTETITNRVFADEAEATDWTKRHGYIIVRTIWRDWPDKGR